MTQQKNKMLSPKMDVVFQAIFGEVGSEDITKDFLEKILKRKINKINLDKNPILRRELIDDKLGILDVITELDGKEKCNIEMQMVRKEFLEERLLEYWSKVYSGQIKAGDEYSVLEKTIVILIANFTIPHIKNVGYLSKWQILETNLSEKIILTDKLEIDIIELPKIKGKEQEKDQLLDWLMFLENPKSERVARKMEENTNLKKAVEKLDRISQDEKMQRIAELREKARRDEKTLYTQAINKGKNIGMAKGIEKGIEKGIAKGKAESRIEIAKNMLKKRIHISDIVEITGLTKEEIENL